jgi:hypothetical protein
MAKHSKKTQKSRAKVQDFVIVTVAEDLDQARDRETLLKNNDIPAVVKEQYGESSETNGYAVLVPEDCLDEAHVVIESQDTYDDFYDSAIEDDDDMDFNSDFFDDDF